MPDTIEIRLDGKIAGEAVSPLNFPLPELLHLLSHFVAAVRAESDALTDTMGTDFLSLTSIEPGSNRLILGTGPAAAAAIARITRALAERDFSILTANAQTELRTGFGRVIRRGVSVQLVGEETTPAFSESNPLPQPIAPGLFKEETELPVFVNRVGNESKPTAAVRLYTTKAVGGRDELTVQLDHGLAVRLAPYLFKDVVLIGEATWHTIREPWRLSSFRVRNFTPLEGDPRGELPTPDDVFDRLADAAPGVWDGVSPVDYVKNLRNEAEQPEGDG